MDWQPACRTRKEERKGSWTEHLKTPATFYSRYQQSYKKRTVTLCSLLYSSFDRFLLIV